MAETTPPPAAGSNQGQQGQAQGQDSDTIRKLREKVREANAQSEVNRLMKGGRQRQAGGYVR